MERTVTIKTRTETRQVGPLSMRATLQPDTLDEAKRTVEMVFSVGAKVLRSTWYDGPFYEELVMTPEACRLDRLNNGAPLLDSHDGGSSLRVYGVVEPGTAKIVKGEGRCTVRFDTAENDPDADKLFRKVKAGIVTNVSVGYRSHTIEKITKEGEKVPTFRVTSWTPYEVSSCPMGADDGAGFRSAESAQTHEVTITHRGDDPKEQDMKNRKKLQSPDDGNGGGGTPPAPAPLDLAAIRAEAVRLDRERRAGIEHACKALGPSGAERAAKYVADDKMTLDAVRAAVLDELATRDVDEAPEAHSRVTGVEGGDELDKLVRGVSAAVFAGAGVHGRKVFEAKKRGIDGFDKVETDPGQFRGLRLSDVMRLIVERSGKSTRGIYDREQLFKLALKTRASTSDFSVLFENIMYKTLRAAYAVQEHTWRRWVSTETNKDFKASNRLMKGAFGTTLPVVEENAEFQQIAIPDGDKLELTTETRGGIIGLSRQAIINDDMGALVSIASDFGQLAADTLEAEAYRVLLLNSGLGPTVDGNPFFHSSNANVGTGSALGVAGLDADRTTFGSHARGNSYIDQIPSILLIPQGLKGAAEILNKSATDHTAALDGKPNIVQGMFQDIVTTNRLTGTRRYMFTSNKDSFKMVFLEGSGEGPTMSSEEGFDVDGIRWKARIDAKMNPFDPKTALTNAGA
jgi:HK97 family phage prohead protease